LITALNQVDDKFLHWNIDKNECNSLRNAYHHFIIMVLVLVLVSVLVLVWLLVWLLVLVLVLVWVLVWVLVLVLVLVLPPSLRMTSMEEKGWYSQVH